MKLKAKGIYDGDKANPNIRHKYVVNFSVESDEKDENGKPLIIVNRELKEGDQVFVICDHLLASEYDGYLMESKVSEGMNLYRKILRDKVVSLHNLDHPTIEGRQLTMEEVLNSYGHKMASDIIRDIAFHLISSSRLDEEETKN